MFGIFAFFAKYLPLIRVLGVLIIFVGYMTFIYHKGVASEQAREQQLAIKEAKIHAKIEEKNMLSSDADLDKRLSKWMRD